MFIKSIKFQNAKVLRNTVLPLGRFTLLIGPNGSGKTTALRALASFVHGTWPWPEGFSVGLEGEPRTWQASMELTWSGKFDEESLESITSSIHSRKNLYHFDTKQVSGRVIDSVRDWLRNCFTTQAIADE